MTRLDRKTGALFLLLLAFLAARANGLIDTQADEADNGKLLVLVVRESADDGQKFGGESVLLRTGDSAEFFSGERHTLKILDDDSASPLLATYGDELSRLGSPALVIADKGSGRVLAARQLTGDWSAAGIVAQSKKLAGAAE